MSLFTQLLRDIPDKRHAVSSILLRARILAAEIPSPKLKSWVQAELNGYEDLNVPKYRRIPIENRGNFYGDEVKFNVLLPILHLPDGVRKFFEAIPWLSSVGVIEATIQERKYWFHVPWLDPCKEIYRRMPGVTVNGCTLEKPRHVILRSTLRGVLHDIRMHLLEFLLQLAEDMPELKTNESGFSKLSEAGVEPLVDRFIFHNCSITGDPTLSKNQIVAENLKVEGNVIMADRIRDSFNQIVSSGVLPARIIPHLKGVSESVLEICREQPEKAADVLQDFEILSGEVKKESPRIQWIKTACNGLIEIGKETGKAVLVASVAALVEHFIKPTPLT